MNAHRGIDAHAPAPSRSPRAQRLVIMALLALDCIGLVELGVHSVGAHAAALGAIVVAVLLALLP